MATGISYKGINFAGMGSVENPSFAPAVRDAFRTVHKYLSDIDKSIAKISGPAAPTGGLTSPAYVCVTLPGEKLLPNARRLTGTSPVVVTDGGAQQSINVAVTLSSASPADSAATASAGVGTLPSRDDHVHRFPSALMEYTNSKKITLTSTALASTLTTDVGTFILAGATIFRPSSTNAIDFGAASQLWKSGKFGTGGLSTTGVLTGDSLVLNAAQNLSSSLIPISDGGINLGDSTHRFSDMFGGQLWLYDQTATTYNLQVIADSSVTATADRTLTLNMKNANRTLALGGNVVFPSGSAYTPTNVTTDRSYDANATTVDELADVLGTLIADLQTAGVIT